MPYARYFIATLLAVAALVGCDRTLGVPDIARVHAPDSAMAPYLSFLPAEQITSGDLIDFDRSDASVRALLSRAERLRARARWLDQQD